jgi:hypothetical protein
MIVSFHPMLFRETYKEVFAQRRLAPDEPTLQKLLKFSGFSKNLVENFIRFPTSKRLHKTEFGAKSYHQNTEGQRRR